MSKANLTISDAEKLLKVLRALIDTSIRATDLENVYNDDTGESFTWREVAVSEMNLRRAINKP